MTLTSLPWSVETAERERQSRLEVVFKVTGPLAALPVWSEKFNAATALKAVEACFSVWKLLGSFHYSWM